MPYDRNYIENRLQQIKQRLSYPVTETEKKAGTHVFKHVDLDSIDQEFDR